LGNFSINPGHNFWIHAFAGMTGRQILYPIVIPAEAGSQKTITICGSPDLVENLRVWQLIIFIFLYESI